MNPLDAVLRRTTTPTFKRVSSILLATATAGMLFFTPVLPAHAAPGSSQHRIATTQSSRHDDSGPKIVPKDSDETSDEDGGEDDTDNHTVVIQYGGDEKDNSGDSSDTNQPDDDSGSQGSGAPLKLKGIMPAKADLSPNQWTGAFDSRLVEPFAVAPQPARLVSTAIGLDAPITVREIVGGEMQTPKDEFEVTWYKETASAGETGNMVFAGHLNWYGVPQAVFYNINALTKGDEIVVTGDNGVQYTYKVKWVKLIETADADMDKLVGTTKKPSLTLITCGGEWDAAAGQYRQRTVVRAELVVQK